MKDHTPGQVAYFSMDEHNDIIQSRMARGKTSCVFENDYVTILNSAWKIRIVKAVDVPLSLGGRAPFMIQNVLAATLAAYLSKVKPSDIRQALTTFVPGHGTTPGRINQLRVRGIDILIDFAHNPAGYRALAGLVARLPAERKIATISACGDRRDIDIQQMGRIAAEMFTEIVIRETPRYRRGRTVGTIADLLQGAILDAGFPAEHVRVANDEPHAVRQVLEAAHGGDLVVIIADDVDRCHEEVERFKDRAEPLEVTPADIPNVERYDQGSPEPARHGV